MKPIISPWMIYFAELADSINMAFLFVAFIAFIIMAFAFIPYMDNKKDETLKQCLKKSFIWFCISVQNHLKWIYHLYTMKTMMKNWNTSTN